MAAETGTYPPARLADLTINPIRALSAQEAKSVAADLRDWGKAEPPIARLLAGDSVVKDFAAAALTLSPFLRDVARISPSLLAEALDGDLRASLRATIDGARKSWTAATETELMALLRQAKRRAAFAIALGDLSGLFDGAEATGWLTSLAEACIAAAIDHLLLAAHNGGKLTLDRKSVV